MSNQKLKTMENKSWNKFKDMLRSKYRDQDIRFECLYQFEIDKREAEMWSIIIGEVWIFTIVVSNGTESGYQLYHQTPYITFGEDLDAFDRHYQEVKVKHEKDRGY